MNRSSMNGCFHKYGFRQNAHKKGGILVNCLTIPLSAGIAVTFRLTANSITIDAAALIT